MSARAATRQALREPVRIIVVDDLACVRGTMTELLRSAGYEVVAVESGPAALAELGRRGADLLLTDLAMPGMSGWDLVNAVRGQETTNPRGLPICIGLYSPMLSAFNREQLARARIDFVLTRLTEPAAVLEAVERALAWADVQ